CNCDGFQEKLRQQHENSMHKELEKLLSTTSGAEAEVSGRRGGVKDAILIIHLP
uniref:Uncharacterized protein n=1 Tax=Astyanax mexicanus TaxID=7994 RepID=A0A3B1K2G9_ASTMX